MRTILKTAAAAAIALPALTAAGFAQGTGAQDSAPAATPQASPQAGAPANQPAVAAQAKEPITVDTVVASIEDAGNAAEAITGAEVKRVGVIAIDERAGAETTAKVDEAVAANEEKVAALQSAISHHEDLGARLSKGGLDVTKVVAVEVMPSGDLLLFVRA
ncbi:hypothetical protein [Afifella sp. IM 167]|uniref:hypothetical protein n=1 Tax=Afifella sp. IM 167 TaxID=2033586 RepID=UPI001CCCAD74|nr:hypothetical protein [Afifella sp. IM 167]MBZ8134032.1 hypothetical protein [Afifella sp. IM 167]